MKTTEKKDHLLPEEKGNAVTNSLKKVGETLKSKAALATGALSIFIALNVATPKEATSQTLVNTKEYSLILQNAKNSQENI